MNDPYFITLAGITLSAILYMMVCSIYEAVNNWRRVNRYSGQLPDEEYFPAETLCSILNIDQERLRDFTQKQVISRFEAEKIIKNLVLQDWWL